MKKMFIPLLSALMLSACSSTNIQYLNQNTAIIYGSGMSNVSMADLNHDMFMKAAHKAEKGGFQYFQIIGQRKQMDEHTYYSPGYSYSSGYGGFGGPWGGGFGGWGGYGGGWGGGFTSYSPPHMGVYFQPNAEYLVKFYHTGEIDPKINGVFNTQLVLQMNN